MAEPYCQVLIHNSRREEFPGVHGKRFLARPDTVLEALQWVTNPEANRDYSQEWWNCVSRYARSICNLPRPNPSYHWRDAQELLRDRTIRDLDVYYRMLLVTSGLKPTSPELDIDAIAEQDGESSPLSYTNGIGFITTFHIVPETRCIEGACPENMLFLVQRLPEYRV